MSKEEIIDYVMTTPSNPNKAVLEGMLDSIAEAGGGTGIETVMLRVGYDYTGYGFVIDLDELRSVYTALENNDKPLWIQFHSAENGELLAVQWVASAVYTIEPIENSISISASNIDDGGNVEVMNLEWYTDSDGVGGALILTNLQQAIKRMLYTERNAQLFKIQFKKTVLTVFFITISIPNSLLYSSFSSSVASLPKVNNLLPLSLPHSTSALLHHYMLLYYKTLHIYFPILLHYVQSES